jgi:deoxyribodipyrimidine photolyase
MTKDEALKLALETLERSVATCFDQYAHEQVMSWPEHFVNQTITALKEALAQEQEPLAWISTGTARMIHWTADKPAYGDDWVPLYTAPPQRT